MKRWEANIYMKCIAILAFGIIAAVFLMTLPVSAKMAQYEALEHEVDNFITEPDETPKKGQIREDSGMPCENPEQFKKWMETYEQKAEEEVQDNEDADCDEEVRTGIPTEDPTEVETALEVGTEADSPVRPIYSVGGDQLNPDIQAYLYQRLADHHIEWFMPYAVMMAYQESHFDCTAVNPHNGIDCGLFQFRAPYYEGQDIFNPYEQIDIFTQQMANRANAGCDVYEMISRHHQSDYGEYNADYVATVLSHERGLKVIGN